jgi:hypothetical protein
MTIKLDKSTSSVVVKCTDCPYWYGFGFDIEHGWRVGAAHEKSIHPGEKQAQANLVNARKHAATRR